MYSPIFVEHVNCDFNLSQVCAKMFTYSAFTEGVMPHEK